MWKKKAYKLINKWIKQHEGSEQMDRALFLKGQSLYDQKSYYSAVEVYEQLLEDYGASSFFEASLKQEMVIAQLFLKGKKRWLWKFIPVSARTEALEILEGVARRWPGSELAAEALMLQGDYYQQHEQYIEAVATYQLLVEHYSHSRYYEPALLQIAKATHAQYRGPEYNDGCLMDARLRYEQYRSRFPGKAESLDISEQIETINWQECDKHLNIADYYTRTKRTGAAEYYLSYIDERWPGLSEK